MTILDRLDAVPGTYWGSGDGPHSGPFIARVTVKEVRGGSIDLDYEAWTQGAGLQHAERALIRRAASGQVILESTLAGQTEPLTFQEGQPGVFGSLDGQQVGVVIDVRDGTLTWAWWWIAEDDQLREQSRAVVRRLLEPLPPLPHQIEPEPAQPARIEPAQPAAVQTAAVETAAVQPPPDDRPASASRQVDASARNGSSAETTARQPISAPWPGVLVLTGMGGVAALARDLAKEVPSAAIVRGDLLARAIVGTEVGDDRNGGAGAEWRSRLAARLSREYAELGHAVLLAELESTGDTVESLLLELDEAGVGPVRLLVVDETTNAHDVLSELPRPGRRRSV